MIINEIGIYLIVDSRFIMQGIGIGRTPSNDLCVIMEKMDGTL